ncbi:Mitochondrial import inner membrane translocase subunit Tim13-like [Oopsacas minuta]|uniref:Mitochondrial import inner membrane translocase subunit n=1 Tax=Oopsacas minuta TaxID=111878 RepID=A0AAV7JJP8_9METZ|nr:Mitochondrial import inner membrane translocase subunit Tim13-like [Oopsacas minuta]
MSDDLSALNNMGSAERAKVMESLRDQMIIQNFQMLYEKMVEKCFTKCITKPSSSLDRYEMRCLELCMDRYTDSWNLISRAYTDRIGSQIGLGHNK